MGALAKRCLVKSGERKKGRARERKRQRNVEHRHCEQVTKKRSENARDEVSFLTYLCEARLSRDE